MDIRTGHLHWPQQQNHDERRLLEPENVTGGSKVNRILGIILCLQLFLCLIVAIFYGLFISRHSSTDTYVDWTANSVGGDSALMFCTYFVLINTMIPISLVVSIEIVKMSQSYFID